MTESTQEYQDIQKNVLSHLRRKGFYTQPLVRAYPVTIKVLEDLIAQGLVTESQNHHRKDRLFNVTALMPSTVVVRNQFTQNLKAGNNCGHSGEFFATLNERFDEVNAKSFVPMGVVASVEVKYIPKNFWEKLIGHKTEHAVFVTFHDGRVVKTPYNTIYQVTRPEF